MQAEHRKLSKQNVSVSSVANYDFARKGSLDVCLIIFAFAEKLRRNKLKTKRL